MTIVPQTSCKPVRLPWLARIPAQWELRRGKSIFDAIDIRSSTGLEELLTVSSNRGVVLRQSANVNDVPSGKLRGIQALLARRPRNQQPLGMVRRVGSIQPSRNSEFCVRGLQVETATQRVCPVHSSSSPIYTVSMGATGTLQRDLDLPTPTHGRSLLRDPFPATTPEEQSAIVRFLDHADEQIQRYIAAKERLIALLEEQRRTLIHQAVTRGLDPNVRLKDSGVEWLGDIPSHGNCVG